MMYGWSKWGGARSGLAKTNRSGIWYCQVCSDKQPVEMPQYMIPFENPDAGVFREFIRVCSLCKWAGARRGLVYAEEFLQQAKPKQDWSA